MIRGIYHQKGQLPKVLIFIGFLLTGFGISTILGLVSAHVIFGIDVIHQPYLLSDFSNTEVVPALKFMQFLHSLGIFIFPVLAFAYVTSEDFLKRLSMKSAINPIHIALTILLMITAIPIINYMVELNGQMKLPAYLKDLELWMRSKEDSAEVITESFMRMDNFLSYSINLVVIGLLPAIGEELLFRGFLQGQLIKRTGNIHLAIWLSAFLFSAMHLQFYGFFPRFILGAVFGYLFVWSGSLWIPVLAHFINNAGAVSLQYFLGREFTEDNIDSFGTSGSDVFYLIASIFLFSVLIYYFQLSRVSLTGPPSQSGESDK